MASGEAKKYEPLISSGLSSKFSPKLWRLLVSDILIRFCEQIPYAFVVLWVMNVVRKGALEFGWLTAIEMGTAMLPLYPGGLFLRQGRTQAVRADYIRILHAFPGGALFLAYHRRC